MRLRPKCPCQSPAVCKPPSPCDLTLTSVRLAHLQFPKQSAGGAAARASGTWHVGPPGGWGQETTVHKEETTQPKSSQVTRQLNRMEGRLGKGTDRFQGRLAVGSSSAGALGDSRGACNRVSFTLTLQPAQLAPQVGAGPASQRPSRTARLGGRPRPHPVSPPPAGACTVTSTLHFIYEDRYLFSRTRCVGLLKPSAPCISASNFSCRRLIFCTLLLPAY